MMGPSGSGKTTILRTISKTLSRALYTSQNDRLLPWLSVIDNVMLFSKLGGKVSVQDRERAENILTEFQLQDVLNAYPHNLSYGMQTRTLLARALFMDAEIYLLDEVFNGLDDATKHDVMVATQRLLNHKTVIFVSHRSCEVKKLCGEFYALYEGKLESGVML